MFAIANETIKTLNSRFGTNVPALSIRDIAKTDPLFQRISDNQDQNNQ